MKTNIMIRNISLTVYLLMAGVLNTFAQSDEALKASIREKAMSVVTKGYETYASINGFDSRAQFLLLFTNEKAPVFNDLIGLSDANMLTAASYADLLGATGLKNRIVNVKNVAISEEPQQKDGKWRVAVSFDKQLSYYNNCGVFISSREYYDADYNLKASMVYDESTQTCLIERISGRIKTLIDELPKDYFVVKMSDKFGEYDKKLSYKRIPLKFNSAKQAIVSGPLDVYGFTNSDEDVVHAIPDINDCGMVTINYKFKSKVKAAPQVRLKLHGDFPLGGSLKADGDEELSKTSSSGMEFGFDLGYKLYDNAGFRLYGFAGLGLSMASLEMNCNKNDYTPNTNADIDGSSYERHYNDLKIDQKVSLTSLAIPVYANLEYAFTNDVAIYANLGVRVDLNMSKKLEDNGSSAKKVYGIYDKVLTTEEASIEWAKAVRSAHGLDQNANGFRNEGDKSLGATVQGELDGVQSAGLSLLAGLGFRYTIPHSPVTIDLGANMIMGLGDVIKVTKDGSTTNNDLVYNEIEKVNGKPISTEHVNSLTNQLKAVKRQSMLLSIGLIYNF